ncbi:MAG: hypothetical protein ACRD4G_12570 [Bryobacteraceae bacterium]
MGTKFNAPDSDQSARKSHHPNEDLDTAESAANLQTSHKSGKHSAAEKLAASRPEFADGRGGQPVDGAFGHDTEEPHTTGRNASPGTDQYRCGACGRFFNTEADLRAHETECRAAKAATAGGRESIP